MVASVISNLFHGYILTSPLALAITAFQIWMLVDAIRQREWFWALFIFVGFGFTAFYYYFVVYRNSPHSLRGFELPGAQHRRRIRELKAQIHHLDNAIHHYQLGDIYFQRGKLELAEASYRASLEREPGDIDARAHLGQCLLRQKKFKEAKNLLLEVVAENSRHDYGYSLMAYAECLAALGETEQAIKTWQQVTGHHSYPRAKVQLAELYITQGKNDAAKGELNEVLNDDVHAPMFQRRRDRVWIRRARKLLRSLP